VDWYLREIIGIYLIQVLIACIVAIIKGMAILRVGGSAPTAQKNHEKWVQHPTENPCLAV